MARGYLGIEICTSKLRYSYVEKRGKGIVLKKTGMHTLPLDVTAPSALSRHIQAIIDEEKLTVHSIFVTLSRKEAPVNHKKFPSLPLKELYDVVEGDIEKIPLFFDREFDFYYQATDLDKRGNEVTFGAVDQRLIKCIIEESRKTTVNLQGIDIAPLNLPVCFPDLTANNQKAVFLIVNEDATILFVHNGKAFEMFYTINVGTLALFESKSVESRVLSYENWIKELKRVLRSYLLNSKDQLVENVWLMWDMEGHVDRLENRLAKELSLNVRVLSLEQMTGVRNDTGNKINPIFLLSLAPLVCFLKKVRTPFSSEYFMRGIRVAKFLRKSLVAAAILALALSSICFLNYVEYTANKQYLDWRIEEMDKKISELDRMAQPLREQEQKYQEVMDNLLKQANFVNALNRVPWSTVLGSVASELPEDLALTSFKFFETGEATFAAKTFEMETIAEFLRRIDESVVLEKGKFDFLREDKFEKQKILDFGIQAQLKALENESVDD